MSSLVGSIQDLGNARHARGKTHASGQFVSVLDGGPWPSGDPQPNAFQTTTSHESSQYGRLPQRKTNANSRGKNGSKMALNRGQATLPLPFGQRHNQSVEALPARSSPGRHGTLHSESQKLISPSRSPQHPLNATGTTTHAAGAAWRQLGPLQRASEDIAKSVEFIRGLDVGHSQKETLSRIEYLSRDNVSLKGYKNEVFVRNQKALTRGSNTDSLEDTRSSVSAQDDVVMDLDTPKESHDPREKRMITRYINKAFSAVTDADSAAALRGRHIARQGTAARLSLEADTTGDTAEQTQYMAAKREEVNAQARRASQELSDFFQTKYGHDGKSTRSKRDDSKEKHTQVLNAEAIANLMLAQGKEKRQAVSKEDLQFMSAGQQVKRYSMYLHQSFYVGQDMFIRHQHDLFIKKAHPAKTSTVFDRLEQDKKNRDENERKRQEDSETASKRSRSRSNANSDFVKSTIQLSASGLGRRK